MKDIEQMELVMPYIVEIFIQRSLVERYLVRHTAGTSGIMPDVFFWISSVLSECQNSTLYTLRPLSSK
jgi:hypothetical protein